ncbi:MULTISPECIES: hypothetical protein, partial [Chromobacterium]
CQSGRWAKAAKQSTFESGYIVNGQQIPLPAGYKQDQCRWIVTSGTNYHGGVPDLFAGQVSLSDSNRVVTCGYRDIGMTIISGNCQYFIGCN